MKPKLECCHCGNEIKEDYYSEKDDDIPLKKKMLTEQKKFNLKINEAEGIIFLEFLIQFPIPADHFWRNNLRNQIIEQIDKQIL